MTSLINTFASAKPDGGRGDNNIYGIRKVAIRTGTGYGGIKMIQHRNQTK